MPEHTSKTQFEGAHGGQLAAALELPNGRPRAFALFAHCFSCSKDIKAARDVARALRDQGLAVLRFDFTGLGASEGDFANTNFSSNVEDLVKAADYLRRDFEAPSILIGHSLGGAAAIVAATKIPELKAVAVIGAPAEADHVVKQLGDKRAEIDQKGSAVVDLAGRPFTIKKQFIDDLEAQGVTRAAAALKKPLLILHSPIDDVVGIENATKIFAAAKHPKSFVSLDTADHLLSDSEVARYAAKTIAAWAHRYLDAHEETDHDAIAALAEWKPASQMVAVEEGAAAQSIEGRALAVNMSIDGFPFVIDASKEDGGDDLGPNPTRTAEAALAACAVMTMEMYARRKKWPLEKARVTVKRVAGEDAHLARSLEKQITLEGPLDDVQRARLGEIADKCPVHKMLSDGVRIHSVVSEERMGESA